VWGDRVALGGCGCSRVEVVERGVGREAPRIEVFGSGCAGFCPPLGTQRHPYSLLLDNSNSRGQ
jgi:hypothetical protein